MSTRRVVLGVLLLVAALIAAMMVVSVKAQAADISGNTLKTSASSCTSNHWSTDYREVSKRIGLEKHTWKIMHELHYRHCWRKVHGKHWVDPMRSVYGCRQIDADDSALRWVRFNLRIWDFDGHAVNPSYIQLECDKESWTEKEIWYLAESKLHKCAGGAPRWKADVKFNIYGDLDVFTQLSSSFWGYYLPTAVDC